MNKIEKYWNKYCHWDGLVEENATQIMYKENFIKAIKELQNEIKILN